MSTQASAKRPGSRSRKPSAPAPIQAAMLPRVNLLPPEIAEDRRFRLVQGALGLAVLAALGVIGLLYISATATERSADEELAAAQGRHTALQRRVGEFKDVPMVLAQVAKAETQLKVAMAPEVRWSKVLSDTYRTLPENVGLTKLDIDQPQDQAPAATVQGAEDKGSIIAIVKLDGQATSNGRNGNREKLAEWLDALAKHEPYSNPYFVMSEVRKKQVVEFNSSADVNDQALSRRYTTGVKAK